MPSRTVRFAFTGLLLAAFIGCDTNPEGPSAKAPTGPINTEKVSTTPGANPPPNPSAAKSKGVSPNEP